MKHFTIITVLTAMLAVTSCGPSRYTANVNLSAIDEFAFIEPHARVTYYETKKGYYHDQLSADAARVLNTVISLERYPFSDVIEMDYQGEDSNIRKWLESFPDVDPARAGRLRVPKDLCRVIENSGHRYGVVVYSYGYIQSEEARRMERIEKAVDKVLDAALEKITGEKSNTTSSSSSSPYGNVMYCTVVDAQEAEVVHFVQEVPFFASHPTDRGDVSSLSQSLLKDLFKK